MPIIPAWFGQMVRPWRTIRAQMTERLAGDGFALTGGRPDNEFNTRYDGDALVGTLHGFGLYRRMWQSCAPIRVGGMGLVLAVAGADWSMEPSDEDDPEALLDAQLVADAMNIEQDLLPDELRDRRIPTPGMDHTFRGFIEATATGVVRDGHSAWEHVWLREGRELHLSQMVPIPAWTIYEWVPNGEGGLAGIMQRAHASGAGKPAWARQYLDQPIPVAKLLLVTSGRESNNWAGESWLRPVVPDYEALVKYSALERVRVEREVLGTPTAMPPLGETWPKKFTNALYQQVRSLRAHERAGLAIGRHAEINWNRPDNVRPEELGEPIRQRERRILMVLLAGEQAMDEARTGNRALGSTIRINSLAGKAALAELVATSLNGVRSRAYTGLVTNIIDYCREGGLGGRKPPRLRVSLPDTELRMQEAEQLIEALNAGMPGQDAWNKLRGMFGLEPLAEDDLDDAGAPQGADEPSPLPAPKPAPDSEPTTGDTSDPPEDPDLDQGAPEREQAEPHGGTHEHAARPGTEWRPWREMRDGEQFTAWRQMVAALDDAVATLPQRINGPLLEALSAAVEQFWADGDAAAGRVTFSPEVRETVRAGALAWWTDLFRQGRRQVRDELRAQAAAAVDARATQMPELPADRQQALAEWGGGMLRLLAEEGDLPATIAAGPYKGTDPERLAAATADDIAAEVVGSTESALTQPARRALATGATAEGFLQSSVGRGLDTTPAEVVRQTSRRVAGEQASSAWNMGREAEFADFVDHNGTDWIEECQRSAFVDHRACEHCISVDGRVFAYGSEEHSQLATPDPACAGGGYCRCVVLLIGRRDLMGPVDGLG